MEGERKRRPNVGRVRELRVADDPAAWAAAGFALTGDVVQLGEVAVRLTGRPDDGRRGITGWTLSGLAVADGSLDGLPTEISAAASAEPAGTEPAGTEPAAEATDTTAEGSPTHPNGAIGIDHVVVATPNLDRTIAACEAAGLDLRRIRDASSAGSPMRQAFFKLGPVVLEVVSGGTGTGLPASDAPATFWGLAIDVDDLDRAAALLGDGLGRIKPAVQRGRRIATLRHEAHGMSVAVAAMDHRADRTVPEDGR